MYPLDVAWDTLTKAREGFLFRGVVGSMGLRGFGSWN